MAAPAAAAATRPTTPVIIGVGDVKNASADPRDAVEPMRLMLQAVERAIADAGASPEALRAQIDSVSVVRTWTWPYADLPGLLAQQLGVRPRHTFYSEQGGNSPALICDEAARRIARGESRVAVITGGEALASLTACAAARKFPPQGWTEPEGGIESVFSPTTLKLPDNLGGVHSLGHPIQVYPLYENAFRAHRGQSIAENNEESARLYAEFAKVAEKHPVAWAHGKPAATQESIGTVSKKNRMICFPYPLLMNAFNTVNLAAACILTSVEVADQLGVPASRRIYPVGGAGTADRDWFWERPNYHTSPSISQSLDAALAASHLNQSQIDLFDFYSFVVLNNSVSGANEQCSCFPIVPKLACHHLGLPCANPPKPITLLGGLTSFGGAGNNYSMHAITEMVRQLRSGVGKHGLVLANGGVLSYQHVVCLSTQPRNGSSPYPEEPPLPKYVPKDIAPVPPVEDRPKGAAIIETYTVDFDRDGRPSCGHVVGRLESNGHRFVANHADSHTLQQLASGSVEPIGRKGWVHKESGAKRNLFTLEERKKL